MKLVIGSESCVLLTPSWKKVEQWSLGAERVSNSVVKFFLSMCKTLCSVSQHCTKQTNKAFDLGSSKQTLSSLL